MNPSPARDRSRRDPEAHEGREHDEEGGEEEVGDEGALPALQGHPEAGYRVAAAPVPDGQLPGISEQLVLDLIGLGCNSKDILGTSPNLFLIMLAGLRHVYLLVPQYSCPGIATKLFIDPCPKF